LPVQPGEDEVALAVKENIPNAKVFPLSKKTDKLLTGTPTAAIEAKSSCGWSDIEKACEPVLR